MFRIFGLILFLLASMPPAIAGGSLSLMGVGGAGSSLAPASKTFAGTTSNTLAASPWSFTSGTLGTATASRQVVAGLSVTNIITAVTVCGNAATRIVQQAGASSSFAEVWIGPCATGTTAAVIVTSSGNITGTVGVWSVDGLLSSTPVATSVSAVNPAVLSAATSSGGLSFAVEWTTSSAVLSANTITADWSNVIPPSSSVQTNGGSQLTTGASSTATYTGGSAAAAMVTLR